ncbi:MAG TPA: hypothetical protein VLW17_00825 [Thermoanaerobaculaceae bacterium]|nr:hypothetical protein [Thermoanaerobaculaceae bacterium]
MHEVRAATVEAVLQEHESRLAFLTAGERAGGWRRAFGDAANRVPTPYWLYSDDEKTPLLLGLALRVSAEWESFLRDLTRLVEAEATYRRSLALHEEINKATLIDLRRAMVGQIGKLFENALLYDYGQRLPEVLWLVLTREVAERIAAVTHAVAADTPQIAPRALDEIRYAIGQRVVDVATRGRTQAVDRVRDTEALQPTSASRAFADQLRDDLLPFVERRLSRDLKELNAYLQGHLRVDASRFQSLFAATTGQLQQLRVADPAFDQVLATIEPEALTLPPERWLFSAAVLDLLQSWPYPRTPRLSADMRRLLSETAARCKRFEVLAAMREHVFPVAERGARTVTQIERRLVNLSSFTRPYDFTAVGVLPSVVRRYGLLYDLVEFTQLLEELRRHGRSTEDSALRTMVRFLAQVDDIRDRHRLKFEKFMGDGAFYSARSARSVLLAAAELRVLYEGLRRQGFAFDRGLRLAMNVGTYHLLPMMTSSADRPHFEFFGHGLVELARLTTGKTTHEVEDIADFLIAAGYDVHNVLQFLEPVRHANRFTEFVKDRPYAAFIAENGELVNLGGVASESFLRDLELEWGDQPIGECEAGGQRWLVLPAGPAGNGGPWVGLRALGTARLKGLEPTPLAEVVVLDQLPAGHTMLPARTPLIVTLQQLAGQAREPEATSAPPAPEVDAKLCVISALEDESTRTWYIGRYEDEVDAMLNAFRLRLNPVGLKDGEPFEAWLFQRRAELAMLYHGLRRDSHGATVPLDQLRRRDGYFACLLAAPHRSPR